MLVAAALATILFVQQREFDETRQRAIYAVTATSWKVSELIFETERLASVLIEYRHNARDREEVKLRFDLLWSRVEVAEQTNIRASPVLAEMLAQYRFFLNKEEAVIYTGKSLPSQEISRLKTLLDQLSHDTRVAWVREFAALQKKDLAENLVDNLGDASNYQFAILALIGLLMAYVLAEIFFASKSQAQEKSLKEQAAQASAAKTQFIANVSHELRTPLNGILGMASELGETNLDADQRSCLRVIQGSGKVLLATVGDVLDLSKIEAGKMELESCPFMLRDAIADSCSLFSATARESNLKLTANIQEEVPKIVLGDEQRFRQVMHNLISNALKFTDYGSVKVLAQTYESGSRLQVSVSDTGPGVPEMARDEIFEPFCQADASNTRKPGGTGLGLSISRAICDAMGGELHLSTEEAQGATFIVDIPLKPVPTTSVDMPSKVPGASRAIGTSELDVLVVDDNKTNRLILRRFLAKSLCRLSEACNGQEAVDCASATKFDVIFMDIQMPIMGGEAATLEIRDNERLKGLPPSTIVAVTANALPEQIEQYHATGMDAVLTKPVSKADLLDLILKLNPKEV